MSKEKESVSSNEEKELRRVYDKLAHFAPKAALQKELDPLEARRHRILSYRKNPDAVKIVDEAGMEMSPEDIEAELERLEDQIEAINAQIEAINAEPDRKISCPDLMAALKSLGKKCSKREVEDMIWEVDENLDGCVDWAEFHLMFQRNIKDKTGLEPFQLFNVVQFMMYDKEGTGAVSVDETMHMLYARYGKDRLEEEMKLLFGDELKTADGGGELSFIQYLDAVSVRVPKKKKEKGKKRMK